MILNMQIENRQNSALLEEWPFVKTQEWPLRDL